MSYDDFQQVKKAYAAFSLQQNSFNPVALEDAAGNNFSLDEIGQFLRRDGASSVSLGLNVSGRTGISGSNDESLTNADLRLFKLGDGTEAGAAKHLEGFDRACNLIAQAMQGWDYLVTGKRSPGREDESEVTRDDVSSL